MDGQSPKGLDAMTQDSKQKNVMHYHQKEKKKFDSNAFLLVFKQKKTYLHRKGRSRKNKGKKEEKKLHMF